MILWKRNEQRLIALINAMASRYHLELGVVEQMIVCRTIQQDQINGDNSGLEFDIFVGDFTTVLL